MKVLSRVRFAAGVPARASARRSARGGVLCGLLFLFAANVGLSAALETTSPELRDPEAGWRLKRLKPVAAAGPVVVAFGTSRTQMAFDPDALPSGSPSAFNFGQAGGGPVVQLLNLKRVLASGVRPTGVLVEIMPAALHQDGPADPLIRPVAVRYSAADVRRLTPYCEDPAGRWQDWAVARANPWHTGRFLLLSHTFPGLLPWTQRVDFQWRDMTARGFCPYPFETVTPEHRAKGFGHAREQYEGNFATYRVDETPARAVEDLRSLCRAEGIPLAFYLLPEAPAFRAMFPPTAEAALQKYLVELRAEHAVFDCREWLPDEAFADGHHLLKSGAATFSKRFGGECLPQAFKELPTVGRR